MKPIFGGCSLAVDLRPPSSGGKLGEPYPQIVRRTVVANHAMELGASFKGTQNCACIDLNPVRAGVVMREGRWLAESRKSAGKPVLHHVLDCGEGVSSD
jgi:hypothetical protein